MAARKRILNNKIILVFIVLAALTMRLLSSSVVFANGRVSFIGCDSFYHMRRIIHTASDFPNYLTFDSYLNYPSGFELGWPPLYDQAAAFLALILGLGSPDTHTIEVAGALLPVLLGVLTLIPIYAAASAIFENKTALFSAGVLAFIPVHLVVSQAGSTDHHVAEILLSTTAYAFFILSLKHARSTDLSFADIKKAGSEKTAAKPLIYAACTGIVLALSVFTWIGSPIFIGLIGLYAFVQFTVDLKENRSSEYLVISGITAYLVTLILITPICASAVRPGFEMSAMFLSWFHVLYVASLLAAFVLLGVLSGFVYSKKLKWWYYPAAVAALVAVGTAALNIFSPEFYHSTVSGLEYISGSGAMLGAISEASPLFYDPDGSFTLAVLWRSFALCFLTAFAAFGPVIRKSIKENYAPETVFFIIWTVVVVLLAVSQRRFTYLLSINISILTGYFITIILGMSKPDRAPRTSKARRTSSKFKLGDIAVIAVIIAVVFVPTVNRSISIASNPSVIPSDWQESLMWLESSTPETSYYSNPIEKPEYGVMSWWDYGNWIVYLAHRPVVTNNFQAGVDDAARFFVTLDESEANAILDRRNVRYVITDMRMAKTKFPSIVQLAGEDADNFYTVQTIKTDAKTRTLRVENDKFKNTILIKLYVFDGASLSNLRLIYESNTTITQNPDVKYVKIFEHVSGAKITGFAAPHENVSAAANVISNRRRTFEYYNTAVANETGWYELTVSYSTEGGPYDTRAVTPYTVRGEKSIIMKEITITEDDVVNGGEIRLDLV